MKSKRLLSIVKTAGLSWYRHNALQLSAALSYYTVFSLGPLLLLAVAIAGALFGEQAASGELVSQIRGLIGDEGAGVIEKVLTSTRFSNANLLASIVGASALLLGATGVFIELRNDLNLIWEVKPDPKQSGWWSLIRDRLLSFALVVAVGFLLLVSLLVSAGLAVVDKYFSEHLPLPSFVLAVISSLASFVLITLLFALIFRVLPSVWLSWRDVWFGSAVTALLFNLGKFGIGLYLGKSAVASAYGASASIIIILVWAYYSSIILLFGAELTKAYAQSTLPNQPQ